MNNIDKTLLLAEGFGADVSSFTSSYVESIIRSPSYVNLIVNVTWAENFPLRKSIALVNDFRSINYDVKSFEKSIILSSRINYLYSISSEAFYINPLTHYSVTPKTKSLGEIIVTYNGNNHSINEMIQDNSLSLDHKARVIAEKAEYFRVELNDSLSNIYNKTQGNKGLSHIVRVNIFKYLINLIFALAFFLFSLYMLISSRSVFVEAFTDLSAFMSISQEAKMMYLFFFGSCFYFFFVVLEGSRLNYIFAPYFFFKRFGKKKAGKVYTKINKEAQKMADYLFLAAKEKRVLDGDIEKFMIQKNYQGELSLYAKCYDVKNDKLKNLFHRLGEIGLAVCIIAALYFTAIYLLKFYKVI